MLLVRLDAIGDALTLVPVVAALRRRGFGIGAVLRPLNAQVFARGALDRIHVVGAAGDGEVVQQLRDARYGAALIATEKPEGYRLATRARIPRRIGFENGWGKPLKTLWIRRMCTRTVFRTAGLDARGPHECQVVFSLVRLVTADYDPPRDPRVLRQYVVDEEPAPDPRIALQVTDKWQRLGASLDDLTELARRMAARHELRCIASASEAKYADAFARRTGLTVESFDELAPWKLAIAAVRSIVAPDSGAAHVAGMIGTPVVSCFAAADFPLQSRRWSPWAAPHRVVAIDGAWPLVASDSLEDLLADSARFSYTG